jgi:deazaflavin-dependent oxidoreductase (nitroreductase family)
MASGEALRRLLQERVELQLAVRGRRSRVEQSRPVWFVVEGDILHLLPVGGSDTNWYRNVLAHPDVTLTVDGESLRATARPVTDPALVAATVERFRARYGASQIARYYSKLDVAVEVELPPGSLTTPA